MFATTRCAATAALLLAAAIARADGPSADLTVTALSGAPAIIAAGNTFTISSTVKTTGAVSRNFAVSFYLSKDAVITTADTVIGSRTIQGLPRNGSSTATTTVAVPSGLAAGTYRVGAIVDPASVVPESNEGNNAVAGSTIQVGASGSVDLAMTALTGAPATTWPGSTFAVSSTVTATGPVAASGFTVAFYLSQDAAISTADGSEGLY